MFAARVEGEEERYRRAGREGLKKSTELPRPVLTFSIVLRVRYGLCSTARFCTVLRACYALCGTDAAYGATRCAVLTRHMVLPGPTGSDPA
eukprot:3013212-Rhodomonas_salina.1